MRLSMVGVPHLAKVGDARNNTNEHLVHLLRVY